MAEPCGLDYQPNAQFRRHRRAARQGSAASSGYAFVIQKHDATRLHYDLRLELDGVMKSWAVTRGPSLVPGEKRLAVQVEDHPIEYNKFEGTIPKGEYGGGTVMIWDRGTWTPEDDPHKGLAKGHLDFALDGEKLHGGWHLVRMRRRPSEKRDNWLLIKQHDDAGARAARQGHSGGEAAARWRPAARSTRSRSTSARSGKQAKREGKRAATKTGARPRPMTRKPTRKRKAGEATKRKTERPPRCS